MIQATSQQNTTQNIARDLYLKGEKTQTAIASQLGVHPKTISYWIKQNKWGEMKSSFQWSPVIIRQNLYAQLEAFSEYILTREDGNHFPDSKEVMIQYKLVAAIFKFPNYSYEEVMGIYKDLLSDKKQSIIDKIAPEKKQTGIDKDSSKNIDNQIITENTRDKEEIKAEKQISDAESSNLSFIPRKNVVLRSGARWLEKGVVFDPKLRVNRKLTKPEWDELIRKGLTKADFKGWHPDC